MDLPAWPPPDSRPVRHYLAAGGRLVSAPPSAGEEPSTFTYDPDDPTPSVGGPLLAPPGKQADNREIEARADVLVFTSAPLLDDVDVIGPVYARVHVRTSLPHADVFVRVCDVHPDGQSLNVVDGIRRLHPATVPAADVTRDEEGVLALDLELFPTAYRFAAGHRIRVQVCGGAFPRYARNLGTGEPLGSGTTTRRCDVEVFHDGDHPSHVELSVAPGDALSEL